MITISKNKAPRQITSSLMTDFIQDIICNLLITGILSATYLICLTDYQINNSIKLSFWKNGYDVL